MCLGKLGLLYPCEKPAHCGNLASEPVDRRFAAYPLSVTLPFKLKKKKRLILLIKIKKSKGFK